MLNNIVVQFTLKMSSPPPRGFTPAGSSRLRHQELLRGGGERKSLYLIKYLFTPLHPVGWRGGWTKGLLYHQNKITVVCFYKTE